MVIARRRVIVACVLLGLFGMWMTSVPLLASPDEPANFVKGAAVVRGDLVGEYVAPEQLKSYWTTIVDIDPQFGSVNGLPWCFAPYPEKNACTYEVATSPQVDGVAWTNMGRYPPLGFLLTGLGTVFGPTNTSLYAGRIIQALACVAGLLCAIEMLSRRRRSLIGLVAALTPGTVFLASTSSPSGLEIAAAIVMWVACPAVLDGQSQRLDRVAFLVSGVFLIATRPLGAFFYLTILGACAVVEQCSPRVVVARLGRMTFAVHLLAIAFMAWWYVVFFGPATRVPIDFGDTPLSLSTQLESIVRGLPRIVEQYVGNYGWLDTPTPTVGVVLSLVAVFVVALRGVAVHRLVVWVVCGALVVGSAAFTVVSDVNYYEILRTYGSQGRHVAPLLVGVPLLLATHVARNARTMALVAIMTTVVSVWSFAVMIRRYSVGVVPGNVREMWRDPPWVPPLGITTTFVAFALVALGFAAVTWAIESERL